MMTDDPPIETSRARNGLGTAVTPAYEHTQKGIIRPILWASAVGCLVLMLFTPGGELPHVLVLGAVALLFVFLSFAFAGLTVRDEGERLAVRFGPIPLFKRTIPYAMVTAVERDRSTFWAGWGIHWTLKGMLWNIGGFDCVRVVTERRAVRIGTDDPDGLLEFLRAKVRTGEAAERR